MTVALLAPRLPPACDGVGDHAAWVARALAKTGERVVVFSEIHASIPSVDVEFVQSWNLASIVTTLRRMRERRSELLLIEYTPFNFGSRSIAPHAIAAIARLRGIRVGLFLHEGFYGQRSLHKTGGLKRALLGLRDAFIVAASAATFTSSEPRRRELQAAIPWSRSRLHVVPIGANVEPAATEIWSAPSDRPYRLVTFGVVVPKRRLEVLVRVMGAAARRDIGLRLVVIGRVHDERYAQSCMTLARELGVADAVRFTGSLDPSEVSRELMRGHLAITALMEGAVASSGSLLALLAHGLPLLAARTPHDEPVFDGALAYSSDDPEAMLDAALGILRSPDGGAELGRRARSRYERQFRWDEIVRRARRLALEVDCRSAVSAG
jgi:glycosyltransferase involved in cell wall biosynthesis